MGDTETAGLLVGVEAIAAFLGYTKTAAQHLIDKGALPIFRIGSRVHARRSSLNAWIGDLEDKARWAAEGGATGPED